jgi:hypothetical protein
MKTPPDDGPEPEASLIFDLLRGITYDVPTDSHSRIRYLTAKEEREGRKALASLLRTRKRPVPWPSCEQPIERREALFAEACHRLAELIDPGVTDKRKIAFTNHWRRLPQYGPSLKIFRSIEDLVKGGLGVTEAVAEAAEKHGLSTRRIWEIWDLFTEQ